VEWVDRLARRHERHVRESFACSLERAVAEVDRPLRRGGADVAIDRSAVAEAAPLLLQIAARLRGGPLPAEAMRLVRRLVTDSSGPLYSSFAQRSEYPPGTLAWSARQILVAAEWRVPSRGPSELVRG
jgi:hypothetical protein